MAAKGLVHKMKPMNNRERLMAIFDGKSPDCIPWIPRLDVWYEAHKRRGTLPQKFHGWGLREIEKELGLGTPARDRRRQPKGANVPTLVGNTIFRIEFHDLEVNYLEKEHECRIEYITPIGKVSTLEKGSTELDQLGIKGIEVEHMIKEPADYPVVEYIIQHTEIIAEYDDYMAFDQEIGDDGIPMIYVGQDPMNRIIQELIGYNVAYYHLHDYPEHISHLFEVLLEQSESVQRVIVESPAKLILHGQHFDSNMTPTPIFKRYMLPYYQSFIENMHQHGKVVACHGDADTKKLLPLIKESGFDMVECFVTSPMVTVTMEEARAVFGDEVVIWGGIPSVILCDPVTDKDFKEYMFNLFRTISPGDAFILGVADNVVPDAKLERIEWVSNMVMKYGTYPINLE
jgi:hypothetical protein